MAGGTIRTTEQAFVYVKDLDMFEDSPAALYLGTLCEEHGYAYEWKEGRSPNLYKNDQIIHCKSDSFVTLVAPGVTID